MFLGLKFLKPQFNPQSMMFDFEKAAMNARHAARIFFMGNFHILFVYLLSLAQLE